MMATEEATPDQSQEFRSARTIGAQLQQARLDAGMDIAQVARALRIRQVYLRSIEADDYDALPGKTYILGFLRSYAELLGLDGDDVVAHYRRQVENVDLPNRPALNFPVQEPETRLPRAALIVLSIIMAAGAIYGGARYFGDDRLQTVDRVAPVPERLMTAQRPAATPSAPAGTATRQDPASAFAAVTPLTSDQTADTVAVQPDGTRAEKENKTPGTGADSAAPAVEPPSTAATRPAAAEPAPVQTAEASAQPAAQAAVKPARTVPALPSTPPRSTSSIDGRHQAVKDAQVAALSSAATREIKEAAPPAKQEEVVVVARVDSWIEVRDSNNQPLVSLLLRVGDSYRVPEGANYRLVTGDLRGIEVRIDGVAVRQNLGDDHLHRTLTLDVDRLRAGRGAID